ncbi:site-specific DNA-methyltransferase, partial [Chloroflexota bacterium]
MDGKSLNVAEDKLEQLKAILPEAFTEGKVDWEKLRLALGEDVNIQDERYVLNWAGKSDAFRAIQTPTTATLAPVRDESINFDETENIFIEGENLEVLKILQKAYYGKIKMIYIDPPYNTGNDSFVYPDKFSESREEYLKRINDKDEDGLVIREGIFRVNSKESGRYHSNWLSMMYPRLFLARNLLCEDGVIFVSVDDNEVHNLRILMNEIFGEENFIDTIIWKKRYGGGAKEKYLVSLHEYILFYAKDKDQIPNIFIPLDEESIKRYYKFKDNNFEKRGSYRTHPLEATKSVGERKNLVFPIPGPDGQEIMPERQWWWDKDRVMSAIEKGELEFKRSGDGSYTVHTKQYLRNEKGEMRQTKPFSIIDDVFTQHGAQEISDLYG